MSINTNFNLYIDFNERLPYGIYGARRSSAHGIDARFGPTGNESCAVNFDCSNVFDCIFRVELTSHKHKHCRSVPGDMCNRITPTHVLKLTAAVIQAVHIAYRIGILGRKVFPQLISLPTMRAVLLRYGDST